MELEYEKLTKKIIGSAIEVHRQLGPGFIESIYESALVVELHNMGLDVKQQHEMIVEYKGIQVGKHRFDLFVEDTIIVGLKTVKNFEDIHFAIVKSYLKSIKKKHGLLLNFAKTVLDVKRVICK